MEQKSTCVVCGDERVASAEAVTAACFYCSAEQHTHSVCINGHFVCDNCESLPVNQRILKFCASSPKTDPVEIALELMDHYGIQIHGPEHHLLVPACLLTAYLNLTGQTDKKEELLDEVYRRSNFIPGGFCWTNGTCGAAIGVGTFVSIITKAGPLSDREWQLSNLATARALDAIARSGGPRCCKRDTFIGLRTAREFLEELLQVRLPGNRYIICRFHHLNAECTRENCMFYFTHYEGK